MLRDAIPYSCVRRLSSAFVLSSTIQLTGAVASTGNYGLSRILRGVEMTSYVSELSSCYHIHTS